MGATTGRKRAFRRLLLLLLLLRRHKVKAAAEQASIEGEVNPAPKRRNPQATGNPTITPPAWPVKEALGITKWMANKSTNGEKFTRRDRKGREEASEEKKPACPANTDEK
jgi:hypothetical protein